MTFHNIFTKKSNQEKQNKPKTEIIIDNREKQSLVASYLSKEANIKFEQLGIADYLIGDIAIERKSYSDFIHSMINKRLISQLIEIKKYPSCFLIIEGRELKESENLENASRGMILSAILKFQIPIIFSKNEQDTAKFILLLAKKIDKPEQEPALRYMPSSMSKEEQKQFILEGFPDIGPKTAKKLLEKFKTIKNIINAPEEELKEILTFRYEKFKKVLEE